MPTSPTGSLSNSGPGGERPTISTRVKHAVFGAPRDISDRSIFHRLSLIPFLAWVGLGADGLSSSAYGPEEAFRTLGDHTYLAVALVAVMAFTVLVISRAYSRIIEEFPHGGGGYVVATKLLGERAGVISGSALLVDYVLTITVSIAAAGDALFSLMEPGGPLSSTGIDPGWKLWVEAGFILLLTALNIRGVRESVLVLLPIFLIFLLTHAVLIAAGVVVKLPEASATLAATRRGFQEGFTALGLLGMGRVFLHAYSLGGGTYTGIEAEWAGKPMVILPAQGTVNAAARAVSERPAPGHGRRRTAADLVLHAFRPGDGLRHLQAEDLPRAARVISPPGRRGRRRRRGRRA
jgi:hypothetical protein